MGDYVKIELPVTKEAAAVLADDDRRRRAGELLSRMLRPRSPEEDPLVALLAEIQGTAAARGVTDDEIDAELAAYNAERRDRR
jgi:hypothetical protein